jgi:hypothetical protein
MLAGEGFFESVNLMKHSPMAPAMILKQRRPPTRSAQSANGAPPQTRPTSARRARLSSQLIVLAEWQNRLAMDWVEHSLARRVMTTARS